MGVRRIFVAASLIAAFGLGSLAGVGLADDGSVEERIARFWARVNAMQPSDHLGAADLGQWALNLIERDPRARLTVADFRSSTAIMQSALDRAGPGPLPTPTPGAAFGFGNGKKLVPAEVPPGTYRTRSAAANCYWERLSGLGGTLGEIIANENTSGPAVVTIGQADKAFNSSGCGTWTADLSAITPSPTAPFGVGTFIVGVDIAAGTWRSSVGTGCYWQRMSGFGGKLAEIIANENADGPSALVTIAAGDKGFLSSRCGTWTRIG